MDVHAFYIIDDSFFIDFSDPYLKGNKEENRPHYYCFKDEKTNIYWMIPMSAQIIKYERIIQKKESQNKPCDILHISKLDNGQESVFLIQDIFPITDKYIVRHYTFNSVPLKITSTNLNTIIEKKAKNVLGLIRKGVKFMPTQPDVLQIEQCLLTGEPYICNNK